MAKDYYVGIDGGGTKTAAVLLDGEGREIARAVSGSSNVHAVGPAVAKESLRAAIGQVLSTAGLSASGVTAVGLALAGAGRSAERRASRDLLARIAPFGRVVITHDAEAALTGGLGRRPGNVGGPRQGVVLIAGTGSMAYGVSARGESRRAGGWGHLLGDEGGAHWIGLEGLRAVLRAHDGRGPATALTGALLSRLSLPNVDALVGWTYGGEAPVAEIAALAPKVSQAAQDGDAVAGEILRRAGNLLAETLCAVIRGLGMEGEAFEVVLTGGVLRPRGLVWRTVIELLEETAPEARPIEPRYDAAVGAALLAREDGEVDWQIGDR